MRGYIAKQAKLSRLIMAVGFALCFVVALQVSPAVCNLAWANDGYESIKAFNEILRLNKDCSLDVSESITMDFDGIQRHGIKRIIPVQYRRNNNEFSVDLNVDRVTDEKGQAYRYDISKMGRDLIIRIGDPDKTVQGVHVYQIYYRIARAVNFFDGEPEVYWNVTGNEWPFPIENAKATFIPPEGTNIGSIRTACFRGALGSSVHGTVTVDGNSIVFSTSHLDPSQGLTLVARLPEGSVTRPTFVDEVQWFIRDWWSLFVFPGIAFAWMYWQWSINGRDDGDVGAVAVDWEPPKELSPAEVGTVIDEDCSVKDIVATLIDLAARGFYTIREIKKDDFLMFTSKDYEFIRPEKPADVKGLKDYENGFLTGLFSGGHDSVKLSQLRNKFYKHIPEIRTEVYEGLVRNKYFKNNPYSVRMSYQIAAAVMFFGSFFFGSFVNQMSMIGGLIIASIIVFVMSFIMPARTREGVAALRQCLAFQRFVKKAEKERLAVLAKDDPTIFGRLLPFAMVLGVADVWADKFRDLITEPPNWYQPYGYTPGDVFLANHLVDGLGGTMNSASQTLASQPSSSAGSGSSGFSSGGGFSGGGFGGGGGGSW